MGWLVQKSLTELVQRAGQVLHACMSGGYGYDEWGRGGQAVTIITAAGGRAV